MVGRDARSAASPPAGHPRCFAVVSGVCAAGILSGCSPPVLVLHHTLPRVGWAAGSAGAGLWGGGGLWWRVGGVCPCLLAGFGGVRSWCSGVAAGLVSVGCVSGGGAGTRSVPVWFWGSGGGCFRGCEGEAAEVDEGELRGVVGHAVACAALAVDDAF